MRLQWLPITVAICLTLCSCQRERASGDLAAGVTFVGGPVNGLLVERGEQTLAVYGDPRPQPARASHVLFTHHRRDVVWAGRRLVEHGAEAVVPAQEKARFDGVDAFWEEYRTARFHDYAQQSTKVLAHSMPVGRTVSGGGRFTWADLSVEVLDTPGYTRGAVSYLFVVDGQRIACVGDLIYGDGQLFDLYSLQDAIPETNTRGYHGYAARAADVIASLRKVLDWQPDVLVPARGPLITDPERAARRLIERLELLFRAYYRTDALRWYWGDDNLRRRARRVLGDAQPDWMPMATRLRQTPPRWMRKKGTSRLIVSDSGAAFLIDCGTEEVGEWVRGLQSQGLFRKLDGIFVTHYHDDHTHRVQAMAAEHRCPVYAGPEVKDILENPQAHRMPAQTENAIRPVQSLEEGLARRWNEFQFTYTYFPGQAIYHGGLMVERDRGEKFIFVGDSFSPTGLDDYCLHNRHFLHPGLGHFRCLNILRDLDPAYMLVNQHIEPTFRYAPEQIELMIETLHEKRRVISELVPWQDPNFGSDEQWARFYPYGASVRPGQPLELRVVIYNHAPSPKGFTATLHLPPAWRADYDRVTFDVPSRQQGRVSVTIVPAPEAQGLSIITADIAFDDWDLREWIEAMVMVEPAAAAGRGTAAVYR